MQTLMRGLLALSLGMNVWLVSRVLRPLQRLSARTSKLAQGDLSALEQPCDGVREIDALRHTMASMAQHVQRAQAEGLVYRHALTDGQEAERARIAHELHDDTVQSLVAIAQSIELSLNWLEREPDRARSMLGLVRTQAVESVENVRRLIADLRPPALEELGIVAALNMLAQQGDISEIQVSVSGDARRIGASQELALFRIAQEAVRNAQRHGKPSCILLDLTFDRHEVRLVVRDDGTGFTPPTLLDCLAQELHFGLLGIQERVRQLNGTLKLSSRPNEGTAIRVTLPLESVEQPTERVRDPVCGAIIEPQQAYGSTTYEAQRYYFCCPVCQGAFQRQPDTYAAANLLVSQQPFTSS